MIIKNFFSNDQERKFQPIVHIDDAVWRERLIRLVLATPPTTARLTIVAAPAGFGKTTMLAQLARHFEQTGVLVAWLNCDTRDMDPGIFSESLLAALAYSKLSSKKKVRVLLAHVAAHLAAIAEPLAIFIDEYEAASNASVDDLIDAIATVLPPNVTVILASRETPNLPLTQLQLAGKIRIVDADSLRFSFDETRTLLQDCLPDNAVHQVAAYADGWPFALQLARLRAAGGAKDDWVVGARAKMPRKQIFDYLTKEVFSTLDHETIAFLSEVAVLGTLDVLAANAVRQRDDSLSFIQTLSALKPIVVVDESDWSARLHPLLCDYLIDSMEVASPGKRAELHLRAACHLAERHRVYEAVEHAVAGGRLDMAARMIEDAGAFLLLVSEGGLRVRTLLQRLPASTILSYPRLRLLQIGQQIVLGLSSGVEFDRVERIICASDSASNDLARLDLEVARCIVLITQEASTLRFSPWAILENAKRLARTRLADEPRFMCLVLAVEITMLHQYGPVDRCERRTAEIERLYRDMPFHTKPFLSMYHAQNAYARGALDQAEHIIRHSLQQDANFINYRPQFLGQITHVLLGHVYFLRGDLELARAQFSSIVPSESFTMFETHLGVWVEPARCEAALGNPVHAIDLLDAARHYAFEEDLPHLRLVATTTQIEIEVAHGDGAKSAQLAAAMNLDEMWQSAQVPFELLWREVEGIARARYFLQLYGDNPRAALETGNTLLCLSRKAGYRLSEITALLMRARAAQLLGRHAASNEDLQCALDFARKCGVVQMFFGFGAEIMVQIRTLSEQALGETSVWAGHVVTTWEAMFRTRSKVSNGFTPREMDVLCELAKEQTTKAIAKTLMLSPETVKQHLKAIFLKLNVGKREDAITEARRRALMP